MSFPVPLPAAGVPTSTVFHVHLRQNGKFYGLYSFVEQVDEVFLKRHGLDPHGSLYKASHWKYRQALGVQTLIQVNMLTEKHQHVADTQALIGRLYLPMSQKGAHSFTSPITDSVVGPFDQCLLSNLRAPDAKLPCPWASPDWPWAWQAPALGWPYCPQIYRKTLGDEKNWSNLWHFTQGINQDDPAKKFEFLMNHLSVPHVVNELAAEAVMLQQVRIRAVSDL
eukprot:523542-Prorocentrum_minimum.AAC.2